MDDRDEWGERERERERELGKSTAWYDDENDYILKVLSPTKGTIEWYEESTEEKCTISSNGKEMKISKV